MILLMSSQCSLPSLFTIASPDFRHLVQEVKDKMIDFIPTFETTFYLGYCRDNMSMETRDALLVSQMQE